MSKFQLGVAVGLSIGLSVLFIVMALVSLSNDRSFRIKPHTDRIVCRGLDGTEQFGWTRLHKADFYMLSDPKLKDTFSYQEPVTLECHVAGWPGKTFQAHEGWWRKK